MRAAMSASNCDECYIIERSELVGEIIVNKISHNESITRTAVKLIREQVAKTD